jgi:hypothetical protein
MTLDFENLRHFTGSENWYRHSLNPTVLYTDGAKHVADTAGAYWLLDEIALAQQYENAVHAEVSGLETGREGSRRHVDLRGRQRPHCPHQSHSLHRVSGTRHYAVVHQQHHSSTK